MRQKHIIIGTAGHIDHGKTTLIKALTGVDADRLKEEKKRGITIELGFAHFDLPSGKRAGIIDVPGHEKFIKNMLAGVGGMDMVLLVVAADEGFMPQTQEHLDILSLLNIKKGMIVITKKDLVDEDWLLLVKEDIKEKVTGSFLEDAPIIGVSATEQDGLKDLIQQIEHMTEDIEEKNMHLPFRLPIDRVFTISGFGTVITGTQVEGILKEGDMVQLYPSEIEAKVRSIQVHGQKVGCSYAGQRVAINVAGIKKDEIKRGDILAYKDSIKPTRMLDAKITLLKHCKRTIENRSRVRLYHGASEILCRIILLDREQLEPGQSAYVQLRLEEKTAAKREDRFVLRFYSPMETIGGGILLDPYPIKHKRFDEDVLSYLRIKEKGNPKMILEEGFKRYSHEFHELSFYQVHTGFSKDQIKSMVNELLNENKIKKFSEDIYLHNAFLDALKVKVEGILDNYHKNHPLEGGMSKEELRNKVLKTIKGKLYDEMIEYLVQQKVIKQFYHKIALDDFEIVYTPNQKKIRQTLENLYIKDGYQTPTIKEALKDQMNDEEGLQILYGLIEDGILVKLNEEIILHQKYYEEGKDQLIQYIKMHGAISLSEFRDLIQTSRKYALPFLEYLDQCRITKRIQEKRILI